MSLLGKLIFVADMVEEGRNYEGVELLRELYYKDDFELCFRKCLEEEVLHLKNKGQPIYEKTLDAYDFYIKSEEKN
jgi:HD superfamily phosphohydrolase YqeK